MKKRGTGIVLSYSYFILNTIITLFMSPFIIRTIGKTDYGVYQSVSAFVSYLVLLEFGTGTIMSRNISLCKKDGSDDYEIQQNVSTVWSLTVFLGVVICFCSVLFWLMIDTIYANSMTIVQIALGKKLFVLAVIKLVSSFFRHTLNGLILGYEHYSFSKSIEISKIVLRTILLLILLTKAPKVELLVVVDTVLDVAMLLSSLIFCKVKINVKLVFKYFDIDIFKMITPLALAMLLQIISNTANQNVDKFLISIMMTPEDVTVYSVAMSMFGMFSSIATLPVVMFMPQIARDIKAGLSGKALTETLVQPCRLNIIITGMIAFGFLSVGRPFITIFYGTGYLQSWLCAIIVIMPMFFNMFNAVVENVIDVLRQRHTRSIIVLISTILNVTMTIVGIRLIGMLGAALATGLSLIGQCILLNIFYKKKIGLSIGLLFKKSFEGMVPVFLLATIFSSVIQFVIKNLFLQLLIGGSTFVIVFAIVFMKFGANNVEKSTVKQFLKRFVR